MSDRVELPSIGAPIFYADQLQSPSSDAGRADARYGGLLLPRSACGRVGSVRARLLLEKIGADAEKRLPVFRASFVGEQDGCDLHRFGRLCPVRPGLVEHGIIRCLSRATRGLLFFRPGSRAAA